jgi:hypothetical protein
MGLLGARGPMDIIWSVKHGGNRRRRNHRKEWILKRDRRKFIASSGFCAPKISHSTWLDRHRSHYIKKIDDETIELYLPDHIDFEENYTDTVHRFAALRGAANAGYRIKELVFDNIRIISPAAALVLASEVDRWNQRVGGRLKSYDHKWDDDIKRLLCGMGFFELLNIRRPAVLADHSSLTFLKFIRGTSAERDSGKLARLLRVNIESLVGTEIHRHFLFEGLSEAITNVGQHAYPRDYLDKSKKQWWLSASYRKTERELVVMFYDQGTGIPNTLPTKWASFELVKKLFSSWTNSQKIEAAMEYGRSSTGRSERGKGLQNLLEFAKAHDEGKLSIYSHHGLYRVICSKKDGIKTLLRDHEHSIGGTLIEWSVKL